MERIHIHGSHVSYPDFQMDLTVRRPLPFITTRGCKFAYELRADNVVRIKGMWWNVDKVSPVLDVEHEIS